MAEMQKTVGDTYHRYRLGHLWVRKVGLYRICVLNVQSEKQIISIIDNHMRQTM